MRIGALAAGLTLALSTVAAVQAATYDFTFTGTTYDASGVFRTSGPANGDGSFNIPSGSGALTSSDTTLPQGAFTLLAGSGTTPDGQSTYSNTYTPGTDVFGGAGSEFTGSNFELNIYNGVVANYLLCPGNCASVPGTADYNPGDVGMLNISAVPEPTTWALMILGLGGIGIAFRQAKRRHGFRFKDAFAA